MPEPLVTDADGLIARLKQACAGIRPSNRLIVALAGPPGAGKSTLAERAVESINANHPGASALLPMDGFHLDDGLLEARGRLAMKGAPDTFDVGGLKAMLERLRANLEPDIMAPAFDRALEIARAGAIPIRRDARLILVEGNYLLLDEAPWSGLRPFFDRTILIEADAVELTRRLRMRWAGHGLDEAGIRRKLDAVDLPNGRLVANKSCTPDIIVRFD